MTQLTQSQLITVRNPDQSTRLYLAKYEPNIVFEAQIASGTATKGMQVITFENVITGSYSNIVAGQSLYIGSAPDAWDIGRVRVRSANATSITVAVDYEIQYAAQQYLTVRNFHEMWPVFPQAVLNTGTLQVTYFKDWDIAYSDQNVNFDPIIIMGTDFAGFWDTVNTGTGGNGIYFTATGSYTVDGSTITSYAWTFPAGCNITSSSAGTPGNVQFPGPGMYVVSLTVNASNGKSSTAYRHIMLLNRHIGFPEGAPIDIPGYRKGQVALPYEDISDWEFGEITEDHINGAISKITVRNRSKEFRDGDLVIIFAEDLYGGNLISFGSYPGRESIVFMGYVDQAETVWDFQSSKTDFVIKGGAAYLANKEMFNVTVRDTQGTPTDWTYIKNMTINKALIHYVRWHSTILQVDDFHCVTTGEGNYKEDLIVFPKAEILTNLTNFCQQKLLAFCSSNRHGDFYTEIDLQILLTGSRPASVMSFIESDWLGTPKITEIIEEPLSNVLMGGVCYDPSTIAFITGVPLLSRAPGYWQTYVGKSQNVSGLTLTSQTQLNNICGLYFYKQNNETPAIQFDLANNMRNIDIYPQEFYNYSISGTATYRGLTWVGKRIIPRKITYKLQDFVLKQNITFEPETYGPPGDTVIIPTTLPKGNCSNCNVPPPCDCVVNPTCGGCPPPIGIGDQNHVFVVTNSIIAYTKNFLDPSPHWVDKRGGTTFSNIEDFVLDSFDPGNTGYIVTNNTLYSCTNLQAASPTWTVVATIGGGTFGTSATELYLLSSSITQSGLLWVGWDGINGSSQPVGGITRLTLNSARTAISTNSNLVYGTDTSGAGAFAQTRRLVQQWDDATIMWLACLSFGAGGLYKITWNGSSLSGSKYVSGRPFTGGPGDMEAAYPDADQTQLYFNADGGLMHTYVSTNRGVSFTDVKDTGVGVFGTGRIQPHHFFNIATANKSDIVYAVPFNNLDGSGNFHFYRSKDQGSTWSSILLGGNVGAPVACALGRWPYNADVMYWLVYSATAPDAGIWYSSDGMVSKSNKIGDWATTFGSAWSAISYAVMIVPEWLAV